MKPSKSTLTASEYVSQLSVVLRSAGGESRADNYLSVLRSVLRAYDDESLLLKTLFTREFLFNYETFLTGTKCARSTILSYMSTLHAIYNKAIKTNCLNAVDGLFEGIFIGVAPTPKRAVGNNIVATLFAADFSEVPQLEFCCDMFLLSVLLQGIAFVDLAYLRKEDLSDGLIVYRRRKTDRPVEVAVVDEACTLLNKYAHQVQDSPYLLPLLTGTGKSPLYVECRSALRRQNRQLEKLTEYLGIREHLTTHVARHCWATYTYHSGTELGVVSQGMGHQTEKVTRTYLSQFRHHRLEQANYGMLHYVFSGIFDVPAKHTCPKKLMAIIRRAKELKRFLQQNGREKNAARRSLIRKMKIKN